MRRRDIMMASVACLFSPLGAGAQSPPPFPEPERTVRRNILRSRLDPAVVIRVPREARYLGAARWPLYGTADCEVHVFAEITRARSVKRLYWIQFEQYLPQSPNARYDYNKPVNIRETRWGKTWWRRARFGPTSEKPAPGSDLERVTGLIAQAGYSLPANIINVKFVRMLDDPNDTGTGRKELLLFYWEDMADVGAVWTDLITNDRPNERWAAIEGPLVKRAAARYKVTFEGA